MTYVFFEGGDELPSGVLRWKDTMLEDAAKRFAKDRAQNPMHIVYGKDAHAADDSDEDQQDGDSMHIVDIVMNAHPCMMVLLMPLFHYMSRKRRRVLYRARSENKRICIG